MSLIKKTFVLTDKKPVGYVTLVRVGNESGVKIVGDTFKQGMYAYIKIDKSSQILPIAGKRTESELSIPLENTDNISCIVFEEKQIIAKGGRELSEREIEDIFPKNQDKRTIDEQTTELSPPDISENERTNAVISEEPALNEQDEAIPVVEKTDEDRKTQASDTDERSMLERLGEEKSGYYIGISDRIDELFVVYPAEKKLAELIPESEWVKVNYDGEDYYVVGKLSDGGKVRYLGYGVPGVEKIKPPKVADGIANWFPVSGLDGCDGYWLFFQDASTGKVEM